MSWMRQQAAESLMHATQAGEEVTTLGAKVSLGIGDLAGSHHDSSMTSCRSCFRMSATE